MKGGILTYKLENSSLKHNLTTTCITLLDLKFQYFGQGWEGHVHCNKTISGWGQLHTSNFFPDLGVAMTVHISHQEGAGVVSLLSGGHRELSVEDLCRRRRTS